MTAWPCSVDDGVGQQFGERVVLGRFVDGLDVDDVELRTLGLQAVVQRVQELGGNGIVADLDEQHRAVVVVRLGVGLGNERLHGGIGIADFAVQKHDDQVFLGCFLGDREHGVQGRSQVGAAADGLGVQQAVDLVGRHVLVRYRELVAAEEAQGDAIVVDLAGQLAELAQGFLSVGPAAGTRGVVAAYGLFHGAGDVAEHVHVVLAQLGFQTLDQGLSCVCNRGLGVSGHEDSFDGFGCDIEPLTPIAVGPNGPEIGRSCEGVQAETHH